MMLVHWIVFELRLMLCEFAMMILAVILLVLVLVISVLLAKHRQLIIIQLIVLGPADLQIVAEIHALSSLVLIFTTHSPALEMLFAIEMTLPVVMFAVRSQFAQLMPVFVVLTTI